MLITHDREKLIQAIIYFAENTKYCGKVKLFKLLYFLDFEHYKATGRSVTGLTYNAWPMGPVPVSLHEEIESPKSDMANAIEITENSISDGKKMLSLNPISTFKSDNFTRRELKLLDSLSTEHHHSKSDEMIEATHLENKPWDKVFNQQGSPQSEIPYEYALLDEEKDYMMSVAQERSQLLEAMI